MFAPATTPRHVVEKVNGVLQKALTDPDVVRQLNDQGALPMPGSVETFSRYVQRDTERWTRIVHVRNMRLN